MKAITTHYCGPTNTRGAQVIATEPDEMRVSIPYPYELSGEAAHRKAAEALCAKLGWTGTLVGGSTRTGYVFVFVGEGQ